jgi:predicted ATP-binding protein involved in virulence
MPNKTANYQIIKLYMKIKSLYIQHYKALREFKIDFTYDDKVNPITILTGLNGNGKTTILDFIFNIFKSQIISKENSKSYINIEDTQLLDINCLNQQVLKNNKALLKPILSDNIYYFKAGELYADAKKYIITYIDELIYEHDINSSRVYQQVADSFNQILSTLNIQIQFSKLDKNKELYFKNNAAEDIKFNDLSSGEKQIISKVFILFIAPIKNSIILIDEPEDSLHPDWQNQIMNLYQQIAEKNNNQFIIATHSPYIISSVQHKYVKILAKSDNLITAINASQKTYGKKIEEILLDIFKVKALRTPIIENKLSQLKALLFDNKTETIEFSELLAQLESLLGKFDTDLAAIRLEVLKNKRANEKNK